MEALVKEFGVYILTGLIGVVAYFLRSHADQQQKQIGLLFVKADKLKDELADIRAQVARLEK